MSILTAAILAQQEIPERYHRDYEPLTEIFTELDMVMLGLSMYPVLFTVGVALLIPVLAGLIALLAIPAGIAKLVPSKYTDEYIYEPPLMRD